MPQYFYSNNFYPGHVVNAVYLGNEDGSFQIQVMILTKSGDVVSDIVTLRQYIAIFGNGLIELYKALNAHSQAIKDAAKCAKWQEGRVAS